MDFRFSHLFTSVSDITGLDDAENNLSKIPNNLVQLQEFLEKMGSKLDKLKKEHKEEILQYIDSAKEVNLMTIMFLKFCCCET